MGLWLTKTQYLLFLTALAGYAMHATQLYSLPLPTSLTAFALALPPITGLAIEAATSLTRKGAPRRDALTLGGTTSSGTSTLPLTLTLAVLLVYETVVATLAGTHLAPARSLECGLDEAWKWMFQRKQEEAVRTIQDAFECCGLRRPWDMAAPFLRQGGAGSRACMEMTGRTESCLGSWKAEEQKVAGMLLAVAVGVFLWKVIIVSIPTSQPSWFSQMFDDDTSFRVGRPALEYQGTRVVEEHEPYSDHLPSEDEIRDEVNQGTQRAIEDIQARKQNGKGLVQPSALIQNGNEWSRD
ncbi:MAG: hypothetical protein M1821_003674 [Bathelium mastoideum]|nr:MAG: hypothetical protein M1821_003674 [Bathelium mastoideum]